MPHVEPDVLALLALGEEVASPEELAHLETCAECRGELGGLRRTTRVGRTALGAGELLTPAPRVWDRIVDELEGGDAVQIEPAAAPLPAPVPLRRRARVPLLAAAAAAVVVLAGGAVTWQLTRPEPSALLASAELEPFPAWPDAVGTARLEQDADGERVVRVSLVAPEARDAYREVWLITSDATRLISLGVLDGEEGAFPVPDGIDTEAYDLVDISEEPLDGDPAHSGDSIVRGQLES